MMQAQDWDRLLRQAPPRAVPGALRAAALEGARRWRHSLVLGVAISALIVAASFPWPIHKDLRLDLNGVAGRGEVLDASFANRTVGDGAPLPPRRVYEIRFRYAGADGREYEANSLHFGRLEKGTEVEVEYLASDPQVARVRDGFFVPGGLWEVWWSAVFIVLPLIGIWHYRRWCRRRLALLSHGVVVPGRIARAWCDHPEDDSRGWFEVRYMTAAGDVRVDQQVDREIYRHACALARAGRPVQVLHDPRAPSEHMVVPLVAGPHPSGRAVAGAHQNEDPLVETPC